MVIVNIATYRVEVINASRIGVNVASFTFVFTPMFAVGLAEFVEFLDGFCS